MNARKFIASTSAAVMVAGTIGLAYAQSGGDAPMNPPTAATQGPGTQTGANNTLPYANTPGTPGTMGSTNNAPAPMQTTTQAAPADLPAQADRN
ncbi:MAG: hypothetical protein KA795_03975 [Burkholderiaceae bacterium]|nr:hypothetical protein [Burkholderiaceae bacterium]